MNESALIIIPARMSSSRLPNKPMAPILGKTMIERVWQIAKNVPSASGVVIATDDAVLFQFAKNFGANVVMTSPNCLTGTDRVAEAALQYSGHSIFFNLQADAVLTPPWVVEKVLEVMLKDPSIQMATPAIQLKQKALIDFVKSKKLGSSTGTTVVFDKNYHAMYFSKALIPFSRGEASVVYRHIGLYAYRMQTLQKLGQLPEGTFEKQEKLEQLRALENGISIRVVPVDYLGRTHGSVDRAEDIGFVESIIAKEGELV